MTVKLTPWEKKQNRRMSERIGYDILKNSYRLHVRPGVITFSTHETLKHFLGKCKLCYMLKKQGKKVYTEAQFKHGQADIYLPDYLEIYEVLASETLEEAKEKTKKYPSELLFIHYIKAEDILNGDFRL